MNTVADFNQKNLTGNGLYSHNSQFSITFPVSTRRITWISGWIQKPPLTFLNYKGKIYKIEDFVEQILGCKIVLENAIFFRNFPISRTKSRASVVPRQSRQQLSKMSMRDVRKIRDTMQEAINRQSIDYRNPASFQIRTKNWYSC